jgi:hypothetical protein
MPKYYVIDAYEVESFHDDHKVVEARSAEDAASVYAGERYENDGVDWMQSIDVVVAEDENGNNAMRYTVQRRQEITDEVVQSVDITIPPKTDDEET